MDIQLTLHEMEALNYAASRFREDHSLFPGPLLDNLETALTKLRIELRKDCDERFRKLTGDYEQQWRDDHQEMIEYFEKPRNGLTR
jgi:hypothetical protein